MTAGGEIVRISHDGKRRADRKLRAILLDQVQHEDVRRPFKTVCATR